VSPEFVEWMQGMPIGWTDVGIAKTARLRLLGNAVHVHVAEAVGRWARA
jgi:site-specific DNA-cytosine methylase